MQASSIESIRTVLANYRTSLSSVLACLRTSILTVQRTTYAELVGATTPNQHVVSLVVIAVLQCSEQKRYEKTPDFDLRQFYNDRRCCSGSGVYEHPARRSPDGAGAAACRTEFEFLLVHKVYGGSKQIAASEPAGASTIWQRRASRGCGP